LHFKDNSVVDVDEILLAYQWQYCSDCVEIPYVFSGTGSL